MKILKYILLSTIFVSSTYAIETSYKHDQTANGPISSNLNVDIELELEMNAEFTDPIDYTHIQVLVEKPLEYMTLATGVRAVSEPDPSISDTVYNIMLEGKFNLLDFKNRVRYLYNTEDDEHTIRYRLGYPIKLIASITLTPSAEAFLDEELNYNRTRYASFLSKSINKWTIKLGYEYNNNENKDNTQTIATELEYSF